MNFTEITLFFFKNICPIIIFIMGIFTNILIINVFSRKKFEKISSRNSMRFLAFADLLTILTIITDNNGFGLKFLEISKYSCKISLFLDHFLACNSIYILVYISFERLISIRYTNNRILFKKSFCIAIMIFIIIWNFVIYIFHFLYYDLKLIETHNTNTSYLNNSNKTVSHLKCDIFNKFHQDLLALINLINSTIIPFFMMLTCSLLIIHSIYKTRIKSRCFASRNVNSKKSKQDIQFSITILFLNLVFFLLNLPIRIVDFSFYESEYFSNFLDNLFLCQYICHFFVYLFLNSLFRSELLLLFRINTCQSKKIHSISAL